MSWTDERIQELTRLWQQGLSASEIGKRLGVSKNSIVGKAHRLNLPSRPSPIRQGEEADGAGGAEAAEPQGRAARKPSGKANGRSGAKNGQANGTGNGKANGSAKRKGTGTTGDNPASVRAQVEARGGRSGCLWPIGDPNDPDFHFCGAAAAPGKPYCPEHAARAYITRSRSERDEEAA